MRVIEWTRATSCTGGTSLGNPMRAAITPSEDRPARQSPAGAGRAARSKTARQMSHTGSHAASHDPIIKKFRSCLQAPPELIFLSVVAPFREECRRDFRLDYTTRIGGESRFRSS